MRYVVRLRAQELLDLGDEVAGRRVLSRSMPVDDLLARRAGPRARLRRAPGTPRLRASSARRSRSSAVRPRPAARAARGPRAATASPTTYCGTCTQRPAHGMPASPERALHDRLQPGRAARSRGAAARAPARANAASRWRAPGRGRRCDTSAGMPAERVRLARRRAGARPRRSPPRPSGQRSDGSGPRTSTTSRPDATRPTNVISRPVDDAQSPSSTSAPSAGSAAGPRDR